MSWRIKGKNGLRKAVIGALEYNDEWMSQTYVTATVISPVPINFEIGDYIEYRGERFEINYDPSKIKSAPRFAKGDAFKYENIKFNSLADELTRCDFLDVVLADNHLHFTGLPKFSFFGTVQDLAGRIQANLDRAYPDKWTVTVSPEYTGKKELNVSIDTQKVWDALSILVNDFETYFTIEGRTITIGAAGVPAAHLFKYGKDNGLYEIEQNAESDQAIVTRLRAYGSTRNLPNRYYNSLSGADGEKLIPNNMAVQHLMLPEFPYTTQDPFIDSKNIDTLGVREGTVFFDGSQEGLEEIYPSIEGMTAEQLKSAGVTCNSTGDLDVLIGANVMTDDGVGKIDKNETQITPEPSTFKVTVKDLGFDIKDCVIPGNSESPTVSFKTGMLGGREFEIVECTPIENSSGDVTSYMLELNRVYDDDVKLWFPYKGHNAAAGDKFVILNIKMPDVYIKAAAKRLQEAAESWLAKNDYSRSVYSPKVDEIFMARQHDAAMASGGAIKSLHDTLRAGMLMLFEDEDFNIDASIFIDKIVIKEGEGAIPTYEVTLKEEKTVGRLDKMQNQIDSLASGRGQGGVGGYTAGQIRQMIDAYGDTRFLSKIKDDRTPHTISSDRGFEVGNYVSGAGGGAIGIDPETGDSFADVARLWVRVRAFFEELTVVKASVFAGKNYISPGGGIKCTKVEEVKDSGGNVTAYRCYFLSTQDGEKAETQFAVNDQAISETFNAAAGTSNKISNHRYWRLVTAVSNDAYTDDSGNHYGYIDLSATDCEVDSDIPQAGDEICQLGNRNDADRQSAIMFSTVDADAPSVKLFAGVGSGSTNAEHYSLDGKAVIMFGKNPLTGKVYFRLGTSTATHYLDYTQDGGLTVAGKISALSTITDTSGNESSIGQYITDTANELMAVEYSATGADGTWHSTYTNGDRYMRQSTDGGNTWSGAMLITAQDVTITNQSVEYATSASGTTAPTAGWSTTIPSVAEGQYLWTRTTLTFSDGNSVVSYSVSRQGVDGNSGSDYAPNLLVDSKGPRTIKASSSNNTTYMVFDFDTPIEVKSGDKFTVSFGNIEVLAGSPTEFTASLYNVSGAGWGTYGSSVHVTKDKPWGTLTVSKSILARHLLVYAGKYGATAGNSVKYTDVMLTKGETPAKWVPAASEMLAPVITSQSVTYAKSTTTAQPSDASFTYSSISAANPAQGDYLWTKTVVNYSDGTSTKSYTVSRLGADGSDGTPGDAGADGKTQYTHIAYAQGITAGALPHPTAFTKFQTTAFDGAEYIGFRHDFDQLDPSDHTLYEWSKYKGKDGAGYTPNLLKGANKPLGKGLVDYLFGKYMYDADLEAGKEYTLTVCYHISDANNYMSAWWDEEHNHICSLPYGTAVVTSRKVFPGKDAMYLGFKGVSFYKHAQNGASRDADAYIEWATLTAGDTPQTAWIPAASEMTQTKFINNLLRNSDFSEGTKHWTFTNSYYAKIDTTELLDGRCSLKIDTTNSPGGYPGAKQRVVYEGASAEFTASVYTMMKDVSQRAGNVFFEVHFLNETGAQISANQRVVNPKSDEQWEKYVFHFTSPSGTKMIEVFCWSQDGQTVWYNGMKLEFGNNDNPQWTPNADGLAGAGIVANVIRENFTEAQWNLYGTIGHAEPWSGTDNGRNGCRTGDLFTVSGRATDTGNGHLLTYRSFSDYGMLAGTCISHIITNAGKDAPYTVFQWAKGDYAQPTGTWSDTPLNALPGEFVWMREGVVTPPATTPVWKNGYTRVTGDTGAAGTNYTPNMLTNSKDNKIHVVEKDSDSSKEWRNSTVHLEYKKTYTISARTNAAAFTGDHQDALVSHPNACALWICSAKGSPQGLVNEVVSSADMATDGSKGSVFTWMKPTAGYFLRTNFYKSGTWYVNHVKIEEGDNPNPSWTPHPDEMVGTPGTNGINGQDVFLLDLDNEMVPVTCDAKGNVAGGLPATITARVFKGGTELTSGVTYRNQGTTLTVSQSGNKFEIKGIGKDRDTLVIEAVVAGLTLRSTVTVYKVKPGEDGAPATMYFLEPAESSVTRTAQGGLSVASLGCRKLYVTGSDQRHLTTANTLTAQIYTNGVAGTETVIAADGVTNNGVVTLTDDTTAVVFTLYKGTSTAEADMLDRERVPVLTDAFGLSVGGVNLLRKTNSGIINWTTNTSSNGQIVMEPGTPQSRCVFYHNATTAAPDWQMIGFALPADTIKANCYYMLSFKARVLQSNGTAGGASTQPLQLRWQISKSTGGDRLTNVESRTVTYTETRFTIMMRTTGVPTSQHRLWGYISTTGTAWEALEIWDMQLEEGVVATEYKASPLDFNYLTEALKESTTVEGGVILSSLMRLGYTASDAYRVTAGMNGVLAPSTDGTDPAIWAGGDMLDATSDENSSADLDSLAKLMFRHNGNGYMCGGVVRVLDGRILIGRNRKADGTIKSDAEFAQDCIILDEEGLTYVSGGQDRLLVTSAQVGDTFETKVNAVNWSGTATAFDSIALAHYYSKKMILEPVKPEQTASEDGTEALSTTYLETWSWVPTMNIAQTKTINIGSGTIAVGTVIEVSSLSTSFSITRSHSEGVQITATAALCYTDSAGKVQVVRKVNMSNQYSGNTCSFSMDTTIRHTVQVAASYFVRLTLTPNTYGMGKPLANEYKTVTPATATASGTTKTTRSDVTIIGTDGIKSIWGDGGFLANRNGLKIRGSLWINGKLVTTS